MHVLISTYARPILVHLRVCTDSVETPLSYGNHSTVVKAIDTYTDNLVAVKLLHRDDSLHADAHAEQRMYRAIVLGCDPRIE